MAIVKHMCFAIAFLIPRIQRLFAQKMDEVCHFWKPYSPNDGANNTDTQQKIAFKGTVSTAAQQLVDNLSCMLRMSYV